MAPGANGAITAMLSKGLLVTATFDDSAHDDTFHKKG